MTKYQAVLEKFKGMEVEVLAVSTDNLPTLKYWSKEVLKTEFPLLSDFMRTTAQAYGVLMPQNGMANRTSFLIGIDGKIEHIDEGRTAIDPTGMEQACSRLKKKG